MIFDADVYGGFGYFPWIFVLPFHSIFRVSR